MSDKIHKILATMEECIVDLKIELCDNDFDTVLARKRKDELKANRAKGGFVRAQNLTPERRSEIARNAVKARWDKVRKAKLENIPKDERWIFENPQILEAMDKSMKEAQEGKATKINLEEL